MAGECSEMRLLIQADVDGELGPADAARVGAHVAGCAGCAEVQAQLLALSGRLRRELPYQAASETLHAAVRARLSAAATADRPIAPRPAWWQRLQRPRWTPFAPFAAGFALAACIALVLMLPPGGADTMADAVVADHIRALQPGHLMDVASTDQHTVKPWFDGRIDYAPPVNDYKAQGYPLVGGRLDYLAGRPVAALVYQRRQHMIDVYVWPDDGRTARGRSEGSRGGYNFVRWHQDGMVFWAVSDLGDQELSEFARLWPSS